ncbi:MAG: outer membrane lipoprotein carrier protein LolA [Sphingomonadales bacterium]|nr:outer membrane lipoprotein carrier protein LolA [Sphingomonadales bacterium]
MKNLFQIFAILLLVLVVSPTSPTGHHAYAQDGEESVLDPIESVEVPLAPITFAQEDAKTLDEVRAYLNSIRTLKAGFIQHGANGSTAKGTVHFERPGRIRFEYEGEVPLLIVSDGNILNMIDYDIGQITKWPVNDTPLALLLAEEVNFNSHTTVSTRVEENGMNILAVTASDPENPQQGSLNLMFSQHDDQELELRAWQVIDAQGMLTIVTMNNIEFNTELSHDLWEFDDPRGNLARRSRRR